MIEYLYTVLNQNQINLILCMLVSIPLSLLLGLINNKYFVLALSISTSYTMQSFLFPTQKYFLWIQQAIVYLLILLSPRKIVGAVILIQSFFYLTLIQIRRLNLSYGTNELDITGILMMQTFMYIGLGFNYQDGAQDPNNLIKKAIQRRVVNRPDFLTYLGYVGFLPACLVGPIFQYSDYDNYLNRRQDYQNIPNTIKPALKQFFICIISVSIYFYTSRFPIDYLVSVQFQQQNYLMKIFYIFAVIAHIQYRYIGAWGLGMVSMKISGITFQKIKNQNNQVIQENFDRVQQTSIINFFFNYTIKVKTECWNMSTQKALKRYIYQRVYNEKIIKSQSQKKKLKSKAQYLTLLTSAFWHGIYPGYYITFLHWVFVIQIFHQIFRLRQASPKFDALWTKYKFMMAVELFLSAFCINYFGLFFHLMTLDRIWIYVNATYFIPFIILYIVHILMVQIRIFAGIKKQRPIENDKKST